MKVKYLLVLIFGVSAFFSCKKSKYAAPVDLGYAYYPSNVGHYAIYDVDSTYSVDNAVDSLDYTTTKHFQQKIYIESEYYDNEGRLTLRVEHYKKYFDPNVPYDQLPWSISEVQALNLTKTTAELQEGNEKFLRLIFPPHKGKKWNGNALNSEDKWEYSYSSVHQPFESTLNYDSTLTVSQSGTNDALINTQLGQEIYAKNVGLIYKNLKLMINYPDTMGTEITMTLREYGN